MKEEKKDKSKKKKIIGKVIKKSSDKTIKIEIRMIKYDMVYKKRIILSKKFLVHDEKNEAKAGDKVLVIESRPLSKLKRWRLEKIVEKAK
ncbi:MAG: 30S ribosomal protein S17 [bacterium]|nr:30S ribosomal protein S17 [bacterium]